MTEAFAGLGTGKGASSRLSGAASEPQDSLHLPRTVVSHPVAREGQQKRRSTSPSPRASRGGWAQRRWGHATTGTGSGVTSERSAPQTRGLLQRLAAFRRGSGWPGCERGHQKSGNEQAQL